jgi:hypothetical protein
MRNRCLDKNHQSYHRYGGRGITIDERWNEFSDFYTDMVDGYTKGLDLDRRDNNLGYSKQNCRWLAHIRNIWGQEQRAGSSKYTGVSWFEKRKRWVSRIRSGGKNIQLGTFYNEREAAIAYDLKCLELRGEFARLNRDYFPDDFGRVIELHPVNNIRLIEGFQQAA